MGIGKNKAGGGPLRLTACAASALLGWSMLILPAPVNAKSLDPGQAVDSSQGMPSTGTDNSYQPGSTQTTSTTAKSKSGKTAGQTASGSDAASSDGLRLGI